MPVTNNYMNDDPFLTPTEVIALSFTNQNTDLQLISREVRIIAEIAHIKEPLSDLFYIYLKATFDSAGTGGNADEIILMTDWIKPTLAWFTRFELITEIQHQSTSSGIVTNIPEFSNAVSSTELNVYKQDTYRKGKVMLKEMMEFLNTNAKSFPEFLKGSGTLCNNGSPRVAKTHGMIIY